MFRPILPNAIGPITVSATLGVGSAIRLESALSFLGFGIQPPVPTWGNLLNSASSWLSVAPWLAIPRGLLILCLVLAVHFLGYGLREGMEPKDQFFQSARFAETRLERSRAGDGNAWPE